MDEFVAPLLETLSEAECLRLLTSVPVGRVAVSIGALPAVFPVNFAVCNGTVVFRTVPGTKFDAASAGAVVAFEADSWEPDGSMGWSVMIQGRATEVTDEADLLRVRATGLRSWALGERTDRFVRIDSSGITGRWFRWAKVNPAEHGDLLWFEDS